MDLQCLPKGHVLKGDSGYVEELRSPVCPWRTVETLAFLFWLLSGEALKLPYLPLRDALLHLKPKDNGSAHSWPRTMTKPINLSSLQGGLF